MANNPKVIVCGAGIGGLTVAHELAKRDFEVVVYEKNPIVGGMARSKYAKRKRNNYPVEYSWRIYGAGYKNLLRILEEIPLGETKKDNRKKYAERKKQQKSVFDNLVKISTFIFPRFGKEEVMVSPGATGAKLSGGIRFRDKVRMLDKIIYCGTMSRSRMDSLDHLRWKDFCRDLPPEAKKYLVKLFGPVLGMDTARMSFPVIARMVGILVGGFIGFPGSLYLMGKPTNDGWFDEWVAYLRRKNVAIRTNCEITDFAISEGGGISSVIVKDKNKNRRTKESADYYVCGLPVEAAAKITARNPALSRVPTLKKIPELAKKGRQIQLSVQIFLDKKLRYPAGKKCVLYLPDTPWSLIIEPQDKIWMRTCCTDKSVRSVLSVGICQTDSPGIVHKKPFVDCSSDEVREEVWAQIEESYCLSRILTEDGKSISTAKILFFYVWDGFYFGKKIDSYEPKFSNNANALKYQPECATEIPNFLFATGYTKTDRFIYSMESAAEAGTRCANTILGKYGLPPTKVYSFERRMVLLKPLVLIDYLFFRCGLSHPSRAFFNSSIILLGAYLGAVALVVLVAIIGLFGRY